MPISNCRALAELIPGPLTVIYVSSILSRYGLTRGNPLLLTASSSGNCSPMCQLHNNTGRSEHSLHHSELGLLHQRHRLEAYSGKLLHLSSGLDHLESSGPQTWQEYREEAKTRQRNIAEEVKSVNYTYTFFISCRIDEQQSLIGQCPYFSCKVSPISSQLIIYLRTVKFHVSTL